MRSLSASSLVVVLLLRSVIALEVTPGSSCAVLCLDNPESNPNDPKSSTTTPDDIVCADDEYNTASPGIKFQNCLSCLQTSNATDNATSNTESDTSWFLYNLRYSVDVCLYDFPKASSSKDISSPCDINFACQPLKTALETGITNSTHDTYDYCSVDGDIFAGSNADACLQCLQASPNQAYLANFVTALKAGCQQKPGPGALIGLTGSLFSSDLVNITNPSTPAQNNGGGSSTFTTGAIVGIAVGAGLLFLGGSALFYVYHRKQKRLYAGPASLPSYNPWTGGGSLEPKMATSNHYELRAQNTYMANYQDQNGKDIETRHLLDTFNPNQPELRPYNGLPTHPAYVPTTHSRQASRDSERPVKSNRPDSYAVRAYLNAAEEAKARNIPPPPPPATLRNPAFQSHGSGPAYDQFNNSASHSRASSLGDRGQSLDYQPLLIPNHHQRSQSSQYIHTNQQQSAYRPQLYNPPPPLRTSKVPYLGFPSLPKLRVPKRYAPPTIAVQSEIPTSGAGPPAQGGMPISNRINGPPLEQDPLYNNASEGRRKPPPLPLIIPQTVDRQYRQPWMVEEVEIKSGKSAVFG
ncbi:hypothetical protein F4861DRAFT_247269 [Xylaria intraflava]|nr:hypothetical protein F4861DRAFT_247269 [Xylaria intraflava]